MSSGLTTRSGKTTGIQKHSLIMIKRIFLYLMPAVLIYTASHAQSNYRPGFIVTGQDTTKGFVKLRRAAKNLNYCFFKRDRHDEATKYTPDEITSFGTNDGILYEAKELPEAENKKVFLETLLKGKASLYNYSGAAKGYHFVVEDRYGDLKTIKKEKKEVRRADKTYRMDANRHIGILKNVLDSRKLNYDIESVKLSPKALQKLFEVYHESKGLDYQKFGRIGEDKIRLGISFGIITGKMKIEDFSGEASGNLGYSFGFVLNQNLSRLTNRLSLQLEVLLEAIEYTGLFVSSERRLPVATVTPVIFITTHNLIVDKTAIGIPIVFKYNLPIKAQKFRFSLQGGVNNAFNLDNGVLENVDLEIIRQPFGFAFEFDPSGEFTLSRHQVGFLLGAGIDLKFNKRHRILVDGMYERFVNVFTGEFPSGDPSGSMTNLRIKVGYLF